MNKVLAQFESNKKFSPHNLMNVGFLGAVGGGALSPTYSDDFTGSDVWADAGEIGVDITNDELDFICNGIGDTSVYDLGAGAVSDKFVLRFSEFKFSTLSAASNTVMGIGMSAQNETIDGSENEDAVWFFPRYASSVKDWKYCIWDNKAIAASTITGEINAQDPSTTPTYYLEIIRHSAGTFEFNVYNDAAYSDLRFGTGQVTGDTVTALRYIKLQGSTNGEMIGTIQLVEYWDNVTSV